MTAINAPAGLAPPSTEDPDLTAQLLERSWRLLELYEQLGASTMARVTARRMEHDLKRANDTLVPLERWEGLPERSHGTYVGGPNHVRLRRVLDFVQPGERILDIGIGYGYVTNVLLRSGLPAYYCGVDLTERFLESTRAGLRANGLTEEGVNLEVLNLYDLTPEWALRHRPTLALLLEVLEHVPDTAEAFRRLGSALDPSTSVLFTVPMAGRLEGVWGHASIFDTARVRDLCENAGLHIHYVEPLHNTWILVLASGSSEPPERLTRLLAEPGAEFARSRPRENYGFEQVEFKLPSLPYRRTGAPRRGRARVAVARRKVAATVTRVPELKGAQFGGVGFPVSAPEVIRIELSVEKADGVDAIHLHGLDENGTPVARWRLQRTDAHPLPQEPKTFVIRTSGGGFFVPEGRMEPDKVRRLEVFLEVDESCEEAILRVHRAAYLPLDAG